MSTKLISVHQDKIIYYMHVCLWMIPESCKNVHLLPCFISGGSNTEVTMYFVVCLWKQGKSPLRSSWFILWCHGWGQLYQTTAGAVLYNGWCVWIKSVHVVTVTEDSLIWSLTTGLFRSLESVFLPFVGYVCIKYRNNNCTVDGKHLTTKLQASPSTWTKI